MSDRFDLLIRAALQALALLYGMRRVTVIEWFSEYDQAAGAYPKHEVVNIDVTDQPLYRDQLAEVVVSCDVYHDHVKECFPWETWTSEDGTIRRGLIGRLLTMWVRLEEVTGHQPVASAPAADEPEPEVHCVLAEPHEPHRTTFAPEMGITNGRCPGVTEPSGNPVRPFVLAHEAKRGTAMGGYTAPLVNAGLSEGHATIDGDLNEGVHPLAVLLAAPPVLGGVTADLNSRYAGRSDVVVVAGKDADLPSAGAWRAWASENIAGELRAAGRYADIVTAKAAVDAHPARDSIEESDALRIAEALIDRPRQFKTRWPSFTRIFGVSGVTE